MVNRQLLASLVYAIFFAAPIAGNADQLAPVQFGLAEGNGSSGCVAFDDLDKDDYRRHSPRFQGENFEKNLKLIDKIKELAKKRRIKK